MKFFIKKVFLFFIWVIYCEALLLRSSLQKYTKKIEKIIDTLKTNESFFHKSYDKTAYLVDTYGPRLWGSENLKLAIEDVKDYLIQEGFENVRLEEVPNVPKWVRGLESLTLFSPRPTPTSIPVIGLGMTVSGDVSSEVVIFKSITDLENNSKLADGKIVLFNYNYTSYFDDLVYRISGPSLAAKYGGIGCIIRSLTPNSGIGYLHTGITFYDPKYPKIPAVAVSIDTADMFQRMVDRGQIVKVRLQTSGHIEGTTNSYNVIGEYVGSKFPEQILLIGGHIDTWDVGPQTGANDDTAGFMVCLEAIRTLIKLKMRPKRTLRFIAWSGEEFSQNNSGAQVYAETHKNEMSNHILAFESDMGTRKIWGWGYKGNDILFKLIKKITDNVLGPLLNITSVINNEGYAVDTDPLYENYGIPKIENLNNENANYDYYFTYHHSQADTVNILEPDGMDSNVVGIASLMYLIGDSSDNLLRNEN